MGKNVHEGHRDKVRQRFIEEGLDSFEDHQVLEMLLFYAVPRRDTNELAHRLLERFGTLEAIFDSSVEQIMDKGKVSKNTAVLIKMIPHLSKRLMLIKEGTKPVLDSSERAGQYVTKLFIGKNYEAFYVCCLNAQNHLNYAALVHEGTINEVSIYPRLVVETVLRYKANSVILAHNHPGGSLKPTAPDVEVTKRIRDALRTISVSVSDHIIASGSKYYSFAENGLL